MVQRIARAREYTCDNNGFVCCPNPKDAIFALAPLAAGANRLKTLKISHYTAQADTCGEFWMSFNNYFQITRGW
ncbi:hypothetical protein [Desulfosediminicola flagellatus]|uniref:hypothetical protein n=1 Tax=Desulfosediminicola flagellatus TaxID=2569541 RepID=UPI0010AC1422|nr:hypothetical protein [Desulfosediminicola flagellatus]